MKNILLILLVLIALFMIIISFKAKILPPGLTGLGFIIIGYLFWNKKK